MNFYFFDPGTLDPEAGRRGSGYQSLAFQRFEPMILCSFLWRIRWTTLESHSSKRMMVYKQITCFIKNRFIYFVCFGSKKRFLGSCQIRPSRIFNSAIVYFANHDILFSQPNIKKGLYKHKKICLRTYIIFN